MPRLAAAYHFAALGGRISENGWIIDLAPQHAKLLIGLSVLMSALDGRVGLGLAAQARSALHCSGLRGLPASSVHHRKDGPWSSLVSVSP